MGENIKFEILLAASDFARVYVPKYYSFYFNTRTYF